MTHVDKILDALDEHPEPMSCTKIARATGIRSVLVFNYMPRLCIAGTAQCVDQGRPRLYQRANATVDEIVKRATETQPKWVFDLGGSPV